MNPEHRDALAALGFRIKGIKYSYPDFDDLGPLGILTTNDPKPVDVQISATFESAEAIATLQKNLLILDAIQKSDNEAVRRTMLELRTLLGLTQSNEEDDG